jgi:hypothetical protein
VRTKGYDRQRSGVGTLRPEAAIGKANGSWFVLALESLAEKRAVQPVAQRVAKHKARNKAYALWSLGVAADVLALGVGARRMAAR